MNEKIAELFDKYHGTLTLKIAKKNQVNPTTLRRLVINKEIEQVYPGVYVLPDSFVDQFFSLQQKFTKGIYSHETALFLHELTDLNIGNLDLTFPYGYNRKSLSEDYPIVPHIVLKKWYDIGKMTLKSPIGNDIVSYDMERTICDMWSKRYNPDVYVRNDSLKQYINHEDRDLRKLRRYMRLLDVRQELYTALEVLI